jgi:predicted fused transcriptional regulator/phosphomethylpyrimidine kinase/predicted transcriptional regulator
MRFVEEVVVEAFLPTVRSMLASALRDRGLTQTEVADVLGISQSAVSKYAHGDIERHQAVLADERVQNLVDRIADGLATGEMSRVQALIELEVLIRELEDGDLLARLHADAMPGLAGREIGLDVHDSDSDLLARERVRSSVRRGLRVLESSPGFAALVPYVGSNLVECPPDATDIGDVVGVPGRIVDVEGSIEIPDTPAFGVSEHAAGVLLTARQAGSDACAVLNIRYDPALVEALEAAGETTVEFDAAADYDEAIPAALEGAPDATVLYQTGAHGVEPITYILAADAEAAAQTAIALA